MDKEADVLNDIIDLTLGDCVPPARKITTKSREPTSFGDDRPGTSEAINRIQRPNGAIRKRGSCSLCERSGCTNLENCHHRLCFSHVQEIIGKQSPFVVCPVPDCSKEVSISHPKGLLSTNEYTEFLEDKLKYCQQILRGLNDRNDLTNNEAATSAKNSKAKPNF